MVFTESKVFQRGMKVNDATFFIKILFDSLCMNGIPIFTFS